MKNFFNEEFHPVEMPKLINLMVDNHIPFETSLTFDDTIQLWYPCREHHICDVICHSGSYGHERGLLEMMGLSYDDDDDVTGYLTAQEAFDMIQADWMGWRR